MKDERAEKKLTVPDLLARKKAGERVVMISAPDYPSAIWAERAGVDVISVGDSLGMVCYGFANTIPVTMEMLISHAQAARRGAPNTLIKLSMPYGSYANEDLGVSNALRMMKEADVDAVKIQGGRENVSIIKAIADAGVPIMSHIDLAPHFIHKYGGFKIQGKTAEDALRIIDDAIAIQEAGGLGFEIEAVPIPVAKAVDEAVDIFNFGIGAGPYCCGQILVGFDMLGLFDQFKPKFVKRYAQISDIAVAALKQYASDVREGKFPDEEHSYSMKPEEQEKLARALKERKA